jgi:hypothetical protein
LSAHDDLVYFFGCHYLVVTKQEGFFANLVLMVGPGCEGLREIKVTPHGKSIGLKDIKVQTAQVFQNPQMGFMKFTKDYTATGLNNSIGFFDE